jgi:hypothetical protein
MRWVLVDPYPRPDVAGDHVRALLRHVEKLRPALARASTTLHLQCASELRASAAEPAAPRPNANRLQPSIISVYARA